MNKRMYTTLDTNRMSWDEFGTIMDSLLKTIQYYFKENRIRINAIAPILRNGAIPGTIIANKLGIITHLPVQVKYDYGVNKPVQLLPFYEPLTTTLGASPTILVTESNTFSGESAMRSADIIKTVYPKATLYYATVTRVYRDQEIQLPMYKKSFYGIMTNENFEADNKKANELKLRPKITIFPWETEEKELEDINSYFNEV